MFSRGANAPRDVYSVNTNITAKATADTKLSQIKKSLWQTGAGNCVCLLDGEAHRHGLRRFTALFENPGIYHHLSCIRFKELLSACDYNYPGRFDNNNVTKNEEAERNMAASISIFRINSLSLACLAVAGLILLLATDIAEWILIVVLFAGIAINLAVNLIIWLVKRRKNK